MCMLGAGLRARSRRAQPKNGPKLLCRGGGPADAAQQAVSRGVRKCDSLAQAAGLPQALSSSLRRAREGWKRVEGTCTLPGQALAAEAPAPFVRREKRKAVNGATTTNEF